VIYSEVPETVVTALRSFRRCNPPKRFKAGSVTWRYHDAGLVRMSFSSACMGGSGDIWFQQIEALKERFRCIAVTYPPLPNLDLLRFGILGILEQEKISRVNLVGSSMGGYLAQFLMARDPSLSAGRYSATRFHRTRSFLKGRAWGRDTCRGSGVGHHGRNARNTERVLYPAAGNSELVKAYLYEQTCRPHAEAGFIARCDCLLQSFCPTRSSATENTGAYRRGGQRPSD